MSSCIRLRQEQQQQQQQQQEQRTALLMQTTASPTTVFSSFCIVQQTPKWRWIVTSQLADAQRSIVDVILTSQHRGIARWNGMSPTRVDGSSTGQCRWCSHLANAPEAAPAMTFRCRFGHFRFVPFPAQGFLLVSCSAPLLSYGVRQTDERKNHRIA